MTTANVPTYGIGSGTRRHSGGAVARPISNPIESGQISRIRTAAPATQRKVPTMACPKCGKQSGNLAIISALQRRVRALHAVIKKKDVGMQWHGKRAKRFLAERNHARAQLRKCRARG